MFSIESLDVDYIVSPDNGIADQKAISKEVKDFKRFSENSKVYKFQSIDLSDLPKNFPTLHLFGRKIFDGSFSDTEPTNVLPCKFFKMGLKQYDKDVRVGKVSKLRSHDSHMFVNLFYYDEYGSLDLSRYVKFLIQMGHEVFRIGLSCQGKLPRFITFYDSDFDELEVVQEEISSEDIEESATGTLYEFLSETVTAPCSDKVVIDLGESVTSLKLYPCKTVTPPHALSAEQADFGGLAGFWITVSFEFFKFRFFLSNSQYESYNYSDWAHYTLYTLFKGRYIVTPVPDSYEFSKSTKVVSSKVTSLEVCHDCNTWKCNLNSMYTRFENKACGKFVKSSNSSYNKDDYYSAYTLEPTLIYDEARHDIPHYFLPCGICPTKNFSHSKHMYVTMVNRVYDFNYGVMGVSPIMEPLLGNVVRVTKSSYGVKFVKYQTPHMIPSILSSFKDMPSVCNCSHGIQCDKCGHVIELSRDACISMLKGRKLWDWSDVYKTYHVGGQDYVYTDIPDLDRSFIGSEKDSTMEEVENKYKTFKDSSSFIADLYNDYCSTDPDHYFAKNFRSDHNGKSIPHSLKESIKVKEKRFFGLLNVIKRSAPRDHQRNIWYIVQEFYGKTFGVRKKNYDKAAKEFLHIYRIAKEYEEYGFLTDDQLRDLRARVT